MKGSRLGNYVRFGKKYKITLISISAQKNELEFYFVLIPRKFLLE